MVEPNGGGQPGTVEDGDGTVDVLPGTVLVGTVEDGAGVVGGPGTVEDGAGVVEVLDGTVVVGSTRVVVVGGGQPGSGHTEPIPTSRATSTSTGNSTGITHRRSSCFIHLSFPGCEPRPSHGKARPLSTRKPFNDRPSRSSTSAR